MGALGSGPDSDLLNGRYELHGRLGSGGTADVLKATDLQLGRQVAVKIFRPGADPALEAGFAEEAGLLARLQHPSLVTVYDAGFDGGRAYLVMQLIEGESLRSRLTDAAESSQAVRRIGRQLAEALAHVHAAGIVHRDVKPSNILLDAAGRAHLADFGIARLTDATTRTQEGMFTGTAAYMAPEQVRGDRPGPPADIYALGLVLLQCLTGRLEYEGTPLESAVARLHRAPAIPPETPATLRELITAMTRTEPEFRPDATACARCLQDEQDALRGASSLPFPGLLPPSPRPRAKRAFALGAPFAVLAAVLTLLGLGLSLTDPSPDPAPSVPHRAATTEQDQTRSSSTPPQKPRSVSSTPTTHRSRAPAAATHHPAPPSAPGAREAEKNKGQPHGKKSQKKRGTDKHHKAGHPGGHHFKPDRPGADTKGHPPFP